ncbi:MAG: outer membrane protein assembly factor BamD [Verrucomicrobia bacterium]|nr:outer membrane protein assembly factor BamD [Verrucomicrobiota bacterium]
MRCVSLRWALAAGVLFALVCSCPAPLIYRPGEGWIYESVGGEQWARTRAKDQLDVAEKAFTKPDYRLALRAARRVVSRWPFSDYAPRAQYLAGRSYEAQKRDEKAFKAYQQLVEKYPKEVDYQEVLRRQFEIANRFLGGQRFRIFYGHIPFFPSMEKTVQLYESILKMGPFSEVGPQAQMNIGQARLKQKKYPKAVEAFEQAADRYHDQRKVAADALYQAGLAHTQQAKAAEYDQSAASRAIASFTDFKALYPEDPRTGETDQRVQSLKLEQARGSLEIARFYERRKRWSGALIYYSDVVQKAPDSSYAAEARQRLEELKAHTKGQVAAR